MTAATGHLWRLIEVWRDADWNPPSQARIADRLGVSTSALSDYKYGRHFPPAEVLHRIAEMIQAPYEAVLDAALKDSGYRRPDMRAGDGDDRRAASIGADAETEVPHLRAARTTGRAPGRKRRDD